MTRRLLLPAAVGLLLSCNAWALQMAEKEGLLLYFPGGEAELVAGFTEEIPEMLAFLSHKGLPVHPPLHVILDERLDAPELADRVIPHKEIRIPIRAPGALEDGYTEADPFAYFLFKGLCLQGIYGIRSGIPGVLHKGFGEIISPNRVLPPWVDDGICHLLYSQFRGRALEDPLSERIFDLSPVPDLDIISHHPQVWPGYRAHRIYGRPFMAWLERRYGWAKILDFLQVHGRGIVPYEVDLKANRVFGKSFAGLWRVFRAQHPRGGHGPGGLLVTGYWSEPFVYWNNAGVFPGRLRIAHRGRYGFVDESGTLWVSEYEGRSRIYRYGENIEAALELQSLWDPGPGRVAVGRRGSQSWIVVFPDDGHGGLRHARKAEAGAVQTIPAPAGVIQLSGPVRNHRGHVAVAANLAGNWDIWVHDGQWRRLTDSPSIELDPWWEGDTLVWASNATGRFQIHQADNTPITSAHHAAMLPRDGHFLALTPNGWQIRSYEAALSELPPLHDASEARVTEDAAGAEIAPRAYDPLKSLWPNYIKPDLFAGVSDFQLGIETRGRDVSGDYLLDAGGRYSFDNDFIALQGLFQRKTVGTRYARYPFSFENTTGESVTEERNDVALYWRPFAGERVEHADILKATTGSELRVNELDVSINWRFFSVENGGGTDDEGWLAVAAGKRFGALNTWFNAEAYTENRQSLSGGAALLFGDQILTSLQIMGGKSWGEPTLGHTTFRVGGNLTEGDFTRRPTRVFPVRGFDAAVLEAPTAAAASAEVLVPLANLQLGYQALPVFLHRLKLGGFVDAGFATSEFSSEDLLVGAGFELLTSLEVGWGGFSTFRIGVAWPLKHPDSLDQDGPEVVFQLGRPL